MCGVVGALNIENSSFQMNESYINEMRDQMIHRGPDGAGTWISKDKQIGLGHRRLSILNLDETGAQPMLNDTADVALSYNGEIYNHAEIREEISKIRSFQWKSDHSDTEVVLRAYETWGIDCVHKFRGMFAFALWDEKTQDLWLVRDRIGVKPMYYSVHHGRIVFASEIKALLKDPQQERQMNTEAYYHYLSFLTTPAPQTLFQGIQKIPGGHRLHIRPGQSPRLERYYDVWDHTSPLVGVSEKEITERLIDELRTAVRYRKVSDVPTGVFLSGGIDSSTNAALFADGEEKPIKTFSIGYDQDYGTYKNELHFARQVADLVGSEHHELRLTEKDLMDFLPKMIHLQDEPIADPVCVPVYFVSKLARDKGVIVCQVGEGADELFWGYESWKVKLKLQEMNDWPVPNFIKKAGLQFSSLLGREGRVEHELLRRGTEGLPVFWGGAEAFSEFEKGKLLGGSVKRELQDLSSWDALKPIYDRFQSSAWEKSHLNWMTYLDLNYRLPELLLMRVDKMSMGVSLEGRVPFLDHKFVELAMSIPSHMKTQSGVSKAILKKAVRGIIPDNIIDRKKQGFGVPVYEWCMQGLGDSMKSELSRFCSETGLIDQRGVDQLFDRKAGAKIWYLYNMALWHKTQIEGLSISSGVQAKSSSRQSGVNINSI